MIENVFQITNAPTNNATPANTRKNLVRMESWLLIWLSWVAAALAAVRAVMLGGRMPATWSRNCCADTPADAFTLMLS